MIGQTISHYRILDKLGEGGMGVVYKAQDLTLDRLVALKFLPESSAAGSDSSRFLQEAKAAAALNHPNICTIHGIESADSMTFIVMEFVDGQMLEDRKSSLSLKQAIDIGIQIAEGLAVAHEKGIVHRDIKPENIMIRKDGIVQIMDFGLAKLRGVTRLTKEGSTVGTAGYMSPEQVQGLETDHRSDIFSLGVLLFEMTTGQLPFKGMHETAVAYEIVNVDSPPPSSIRPEIPPELDAIVLECLEKDPKERTQSAGQVAVDLKRYRRESSRSRASRITAARPVTTERVTSARVEAEEPKTVTGRWTSTIRSWLPMTLTALLALAAGIVGSTIVLTSAPPPEPIAAAIEMPPGTEYVSGVGGHSAISPDGTMIVFSAIDSMLQRTLWVRPLRATVAHPLAGTKDAEYPFWSYDSRSIGFFAEGRLRTVSASGGPVLTLAEAPLGRGGTWGSSGTIVFSPNVADANLYAVSASGGPVRKVTAFDSSSGTGPRFPAFLPDGTHFLFTTVELGGGSNNTITYVGSIDGSETREIVRGYSNCVYAAGQILFLRQGILMAQPFDAGSYELKGDAVSIQEGVNSWAPRAKGDFSTSENGILLTSVGGGQSNEEFIWIDANGQQEPLFNATPWVGARLSYDGTRIVYDEVEGQSQRVDVWVYDIPRKVKTRLTLGENNGSRPVWSRDGSRIYYSSEVGASKNNLMERFADGTGKEIPTAQGSNPNSALAPMDVSPDGRTLLVSSILGTVGELGTIDLSDTKRPVPVILLGVRGEAARFSPDGRWIVYQSDQSGKREVYVRSVAAGEGQWQISSGSGEDAVWTPSGIIFYASSLDTYLKVMVTFNGGRPAFSQAKPLFSQATSRFRSIIAQSKDGRRYLGTRPVSIRNNRSLSVVVHWPTLLPK